jgi:transposase InsO family protein
VHCKAYRAVHHPFLDTLHALSSRHDCLAQPDPNLGPEAQKWSISQTDLQVGGSNQVWVADITYTTIAVAFVYVAAILDAWSRAR